ncbi:MAG: hypothetical protein WD356_10115 [Pseudomonadales bacterium]
MTKSLCIAIWLLLLLQGCAVTEPEPESTETLLAQPPDGWKQTYQMNNVTTRLTEFVPSGQTNTDWDTRLSFESFRDLAGADPIEVLLNEVEQDKERCSFIQHFNLYSGYENGYPTSIRLIMCGENERTEKGEIELIKAIQGNDYLYIVRMLERIPPFEVNQPDFATGKMAQWASYFKMVSLCDTAREEHSCPEAEESSE